MSIAEKPSRRTRAARKASSPAPVPSGSAQARRQAAAILEVLAGVRRPSEAAQALETSLPRYYQLERRALAGLLAACEPPPHGPRPDPSRRLAALEREIQRLRRECDRQQALVRAAERSLGLALLAARPPAKAAEGRPAGGGKRRIRRPSVRALKAVRMMRESEEPAAPAGTAVAETTTPEPEAGRT